MDDPYLDIINEQWNNIAKMYDLFRDKKPIVEYELDSKKISTYSANEYIETLTTRTRNETKKKYEKVCNNNQFILFIRDKRNRKLRSYIFNIPATQVVVSDISG
jgi:hypothetical protein